MARHVRAWFDEGDDTYRLLGSFCHDDVEPLKAAPKPVGTKVKARRPASVLATEVGDGPG